MPKTETIPNVQATDVNGGVHSFRLNKAARRRILRRVRELQLKGQMGNSIGASPLDNLELSYFTLIECRVDFASLKYSEDDFLELFDDETAMVTANEIFGTFNEKADPENPPPAATDG